MIAFGSFRLDLRRRTLTNNGEFVPLSGRALDILCCLAKSNNQPLSKHDLLTSVWPNTPVDENYLHVLISAIRKALGPSGRDCLVTVSGLGYRLLTSSVMDLPHAAVQWRPSVAVLPLRNLTSDARQEPVCFGFMEDLAVDLSKTRWISVISLQQVLVQSYNGKPKDPGTSYLLAGSLRCAGSIVRINIRLVDTKTENHIWSGSFDNDVRDDLFVWDRSVTRIVAAVETAILDAEQRRILNREAKSRSAWGAFARGVWHFTKARYDDNEIAVALLHDAIDLDPDFASARQWLAYAYIQNGVHYRTWSIKQSCNVAEPIACAALDLDASDAGSHASLGFIAKIGGDPQAGLAKAEQALALNYYNGDALRLKGGSQIALGLHEDGALSLQYSVDIRPLDPQNWRAFDHRCNSAHIVGDYEAAVAFGYQALRFNPYQTITYPWLISSLARIGRIDDARVVIAQARSAPGPRPFDECAECRSLWLSEADHADVLQGMKIAGWRR